MLLSEIITMGSAPYPGMKRDQLLAFLSEKNVMAKPDNCPRFFYDVMQQCLNHTASGRPGFADVGTMLAQALDEKKEVCIYHNKARRWW